MNKKSNTPSALKPSHGQTLQPASNQVLRKYLPSSNQVQNFMDVTSVPPQMSQEVYYTCVYLVYYRGNTCGLVKLWNSF